MGWDKRKKVEVGTIVRTGLTKEGNEESSPVTFLFGVVDGSPPFLSRDWCDLQICSQVQSLC